MLLWLLACTPAPVHAEMIAVLPREPVSVAPDPVWPETSDVLALLPDRPCAEPRETVFVMAGHANGRTKTGNLGVHGQVEADVNLALAEDLAAHLERTGCFEVVRGRTGTQRPSYRSRIAHAERVGADAFIELHTDARGPLEPVGYTPDAWVYEAEGALGFSVLFNEGGPIGTERRELARSLAGSLVHAGFPPFPEYLGMYDRDEVTGVHIDRRGLMMLREPTVPSVIVETHNAKHFEESLRWREERTREAFVRAVTDGLITWFEGPPPPEPCSAPAATPRDPGRHARSR